MGQPGRGSNPPPRLLILSAFPLATPDTSEIAAQSRPASVHPPSYNPPHPLRNPMSHQPRPGSLSHSAPASPSVPAVSPAAGPPSSVVTDETASRLTRSPASAGGATSPGRAEGQASRQSRPLPPPSAGAGGSADPSGLGFISAGPGKEPCLALASLDDWILPKSLFCCALFWPLPFSALTCDCAQSNSNLSSRG